MNLHLTNDQLRTVCEEVPTGTDLKPLGACMEQVLFSKKGVGLAANQIGSNQRLILIHTEYMKQFFINPVIIKRYGGVKTCREACLSYPGKVVSIVRHKQVTITGYDLNWQPIKRRLKGINAQVAQHEVDHLNAITMIDQGKLLN